jgi:hypothetical protein
MALEALDEVHATEKAAEELEPGEGGQAVAGEAETEIAVDTSVELRFSLSHWRCPFGLVGTCFATPSNHTEGPDFKGKGGSHSLSAAFFHSDFLTD